MGGNGNPIPTLIIYGTMFLLIGNKTPELVTIRYLLSVNKHYNF